MWFVSSCILHLAPTESHTKAPGSSNPSESTPSSTAPPSWTQKRQTGPELLERLRGTKLEQEELLSQTGITDPSEGDFSNCVQPVLATCSKEAIAVSIMLFIDNIHPNKATSTKSFVSQARPTLYFSA